MSTVATHGGTGSVRALCTSLGVAPATYYRARRPRGVAPRPAPPRTLTPDERTRVLTVLHEPRFVDLAPAQVYATLLDEGTYYCAERTMYRVLAAHAEVYERRRQRRAPVYVKPEQLATGPNQLWSWDITKLRGPQPGTWYHLYVVLDVFSRYVVGWLVAPSESATLAKTLLETCCVREGIRREALTVHADRGAAMTSKVVAQLLVELGVAKSHSRPHVSNDNPFSEAQFKTMKYRPDFPERFGSLEDARAFLVDFFRWYHTEHRHSGLGLHTPYDVHTGRAAAIQQARLHVLLAAYAQHPERFVRRPPTPAALPTAVWINPPPPPATPAGTQ